MSTSAKTGKPNDYNDSQIRDWVYLLGVFFAQAVDFIHKKIRTREMIQSLLEALRLFKENKLGVILSTEHRFCNPSFVLRTLKPGTKILYNEETERFQFLDFKDQVIPIPNCQRMGDNSKTSQWIEIFAIGQHKMDFWSLVATLEILSGLYITVQPKQDSDDGQTWTATFRLPGA